MTKRLVEIDDALLEQAREIAGEPTIRATVETGLRLIIEQEAALRHLARLRSEDAFELSPEEMQSLRTP